MACGVSILVVLKVIAVNSDDNPKPIRNTIANTPSMLNAVKFAPNCRPSMKAMTVTIPAWNTERMLAEMTLDVIMTDRETGVLSTLFMKPRRLSQTTDMPTKAVVKTVTNATMLIAMKEK